jgi:hypothetical protein
MESFYIEAEQLKIYNDPIWIEYRFWNQIFSEYFFSGRFKNKPVRLDVSDELISSIARQLNKQEEDIPSALIQVIRGTLFGSYSAFYEHIRIAKKWKASNKNEMPPFTLVLCFFSFVAERMIQDIEFHGNNYYGRLAKDLEINSIEEEGKLCRSYQDFCDFCWDDLNGWLDLWGGELGYPTAKALDRRKYVSIAISQALIRDQDRHILQRIFEEKGLSPRQKISINQMSSILNHWASGHSGNLVNLLKKESIRGQVIEAACAELESWEGETNNFEGKNKTNRLFYLLTFNDYGKPKVNLRICTYLDNLTNKNFKLITEDVMSDESAQAFSEVGNKIEFKELDSFEYFSLEPNNEFPHSEALNTDIKLFNEEADQFLKRDGKYICVFIYEPEISAYKEISNIGLAQKNILLVHQKLSEKVDLFLKKTSRPGYKIYKASDVQNLPQNWTLFSGVQILLALSEVGMEMLCPEYNDHSINLTEGLFLGRNTYLTNVPPFINVVADTAEPSRLVIKQNYAYGKEMNMIELPIEDCVQFIDTKTLNLTDGDYDLIIKSNSSETQSSFKLRSSSNTKLYKSVNDSSLAYKFSPDNYFLSISGSKINTENESNYVRGGFINIANINYDLKVASIKKSLPDMNSVIEDYIQPKLNLKSYTSNLITCHLTGEHEWEIITEKNWEIADINELKDNQPIIHKKYGIGRFAGLRTHTNKEIYIHLRYKGRQPFDVSMGNKDLLYKYTDGPQELAPLHIGPNEGGAKEWLKYQHDQFLPEIWDGTIVEVKCRKCNSTTWKHRNFNKLKTVPIKSFINIKNIEQPSEKIIGISMNNIFDALCYLKEGTFERFCSIAREYDNSAWFPYNLLKELSSLGHLDVELDKTSLKPINWRISDPTLINISFNKFMLLGWRSAEFIELLMTQTEFVGGGHVAIKKDSKFIDNIYIEGVDFKDLNAFAAIISETSTFPLFISDNYCEKLLSSLPTLGELMTSLPKVALPESDLDYFDINQFKWVPVKANCPAGAYRYKVYGNKYFYLPQQKEISNDSLLCDAKLVKYLALKDLHDHWFTYDKETQQLKVPLHMQLPFLYERVAVSASGNLPEIGEYIAYSNLPIKIAEGLAYKLFN